MWMIKVTALQKNDENNNIIPYFHQSTHLATLHQTTMVTSLGIYLIRIRLLWFVMIYDMVSDVLYTQLS